MKKQIYIWLFTVLLCVEYSSGQGIVQITFDGAPVQPPGTAYVVTNYFESGMLFRSLPMAVGFGRVGMDSGSGFPRSGLPDDGSAYLQQTLAPTAALMFSFTNGSLFSLFSVDLAEYSTVVPNAVTVEFVGYHPDGSTVTTSFTSDGIINGTGPLADFQTFYFAGFSDLTRVEIPASSWSLDNLVVGVVPEPTSGALVLMGGLVLWQACRRR